MLILFAKPWRACSHVYPCGCLYRNMSLCIWATPILGLLQWLCHVALMNSVNSQVKSSECRTIVRSEAVCNAPRNHSPPKIVLCTFFHPTALNAAILRPSLAFLQVLSSSSTTAIQFVPTQRPEKIKTLFSMCSRQIFHCTANEHHRQRGRKCVWGIYRKTRGMHALPNCA